MRKSKKSRNTNVNCPVGIPGKPAPALKNIAVKAKPVAGNSARVIAKLPLMPLSEMVGVWRNATVALKDPKKKHLVVAAREVLTGIDAEWKRRGAGEERPEDWFEWPDTQAGVGSGSLVGDWEDVGVLKYLGYQVGKSSDLSSPLREAILGRVFLGELPPAFPRSYLAEWSAPASAGRLRKIAESIASFTRNAKRRRDDRFDLAISDWEHDLLFLHDEYYVGRFRFLWPATK